MHTLLIQRPYDLVAETLSLGRNLALVMLLGPSSRALTLEAVDADGGVFDRFEMNLVNPATVVTCGSGLDTECLTNQCIPKTGKCQMQPANEFKACDAGTPCAASPVLQVTRTMSAPFPASA